MKKLKKYKLLTRPARLSAIKLDELMNDLNTGIETRKLRYQARKRHLMRRQMI